MKLIQLSNGDQRPDRLCQSVDARAGLGHATTLAVEGKFCSNGGLRTKTFFATPITTSEAKFGPGVS